MKTDQEMEKLLMSGKKASLAQDEKNVLKREILMIAKEGLPHEQPTPSSLWMIRGFAAFASFIIVFVGTAYASLSSIPGEPLYGVKVHIAEEMIALMKLDPEERVAYDMELMETRLFEIKELALQEVPRSEDFDMVSDQIEEHVSDVNSTLREESSDEIEPEEKIRLFMELSGVTKAQMLAALESKTLSEFVEHIRDTEASTTAAVASAVEEFVEEESDEVVNQYLSEQIAEVGAYLNASTTDKAERDSAKQFLLDVEEALTDGNAKDALISILEAQELEVVNEYLDEDVPTIE